MKIISLLSFLPLLLTGCTKGGVPVESPIVSLIGHLFGPVGIIVFIVIITIAFFKGK